MSYLKFPKWKYSKDQSIMVADEAEESALEGEWFDLPEHLAAHLARKEEEDRAAKSARKDDDDLDDKIKALKDDLDDLPDLEALKATAKELGLTFGGNTGARKLSEMIKAAIESKGE